MTILFKRLYCHNIFAPSNLSNLVILNEIVYKAPQLNRQCMRRIDNKQYEKKKIVNCVFEIPFLVILPIQTILAMSIGKQKFQCVLQQRMAECGVYLLSFRRAHSNTFR